MNNQKYSQTKIIKMANEKVYPKGIACFEKHQSAPDFVIGTVIITPRELVGWLKENDKYLTDYKGAKQLKLQMLSGTKGPYMVVDTYQKAAQPATEGKDDLPF
jgi:hypothetical protein